MKKALILCGVALILGVCGGAESPCLSPHAALSNEVAALRKRPAVCELPPYLTGDFDAACRAAGEANKRVLVSIGREACGRCQRFYELVRRGDIRIDTNAFTFVRLNIDNMEQREYFLGTFMPPDNRLPFVGVTDGARSEIRPCLTGAPSVEAYRALLRDAASGK